MEWPMEVDMAGTLQKKLWYPSIFIRGIAAKQRKNFNIWNGLLMNSIMFRAGTKRYNQIDLTPTLSVLMSVEIPTPSIGCLIPEMLQSMSLEQQMYAYFYNAHHLLNKARVKFGHDQVRRSGNYTSDSSSKYILIE